MNYYIYPPMAMPSAKAPNNNLRILQLQAENSLQVQPTTATANDPVTKAIMDNIMGKLPAIKSVKCQEMMKNFEENFTKDEKKRCFYCDTCDIYVNSTQQLQTHLSGNKHLKALKKGSSNVTGSFNDIKVNANLFNYHIPTSSNNFNVTTTPGPGKVNKNEKDQFEVVLPPGIQKIPETAASRSIKYFCNNCCVTLNSLIQLKQHVSSKKHKEREKGVGKVKKVWKKPKPYQQPSPSLHTESSSSFIYQYKQPLSCNFVSGGSMF